MNTKVILFGLSHFVKSTSLCATLMYSSRHTSFTTNQYFIYRCYTDASVSFLSLSFFHLFHLFPHLTFALWLTAAFVGGLSGHSFVATIDRARSKVRRSARAVMMSCFNCPNQRRISHGKFFGQRILCLHLTKSEGEND
jgi:hypothetical protein